MARRSIFLKERRSLFSSLPAEPVDQIEATPEQQEEVKNTLICQDCGYELQSLGTTTMVVCPNCGGHRFNNLKKMETHQIGDFKEEGKTFSIKRRRSLFSSLTEDSKMPEPSTFVCQDCDYEFQDQANMESGTHCPNCGGGRVKKSYPCSCEGEEKEFSKIDEFLREYSGQTVETSVVEKVFSERGINEDVLNSGYATETEDGQICFSENSDAIRKMFSKLVISITKELDLPDPVQNTKEDLINQLVHNGNIPQKGIMVIKKVHGMVPCGCGDDRKFEREDNYIKDSGIKNDLGIEFGRPSELPLKDFMNYIDTRYSDAPENIIDQLVNSGSIRISGAKVNIL
jgi:DNA-directed RNA polymerase subunit RPC12/RpoP